MAESIQATAQHLADAEMRHATILKCDLVESTRICRSLDPSDWLALTRAFRKAVEDVVTRHGGYVERWEGDGALVPFGYPDASEDAPESAVRAGLELVEVTRALKVGGVKLDLRVGIASGALAVDLISNTPDGIAINLAERLKTVAEPGGVVIAESTKRLAASFFDYEDVGTRELKGFDQPVQAWRAVRETPVNSRFVAQRLTGTRSEIVGRDAELALLGDVWAKTRQGHGQVVRLVGDAGIGKSRLAKATLDWAVESGASVLEIDCTPSTRNTPLYPLGVLLRRTAAIEVRAPEAEKCARAKELLSRVLSEAAVADALQYLSPLFGLESIALPSNSSPDQVREQTIAVILQILRELAAQRPLAILCEDAHWIDDTTATVIQRIAQELAGIPALLILTMRPDATVEIEAAKIAHYYTDIALQPLSDATAAALVRTVARGAELPLDDIDGIVSRCEGVPLILEEVTRSILEGGVRDEFARAGGLRGSVPAPLQLVVESRLQRCSQFKRIVQAASVLGREFSVRVLADMLSNDTADLVETINLLAEHGLFSQPRPAATDRVRFPHAMIRDAVYQTLLRDDRRRLHSVAADTLMDGYGGTDDASADLLAQHLCEAMRFSEAVKTRLSASADTVARGAYVETEGHCEAALKLVEQIGDAAERRMLQFRLLVQLGVALTGQHGYSAQRVENAYRRARAVCGETAEAEMLYPIMRGLTALHLVRGNLATGHELSLQSMDIAERSKRVEFQIDAMSVHCYAVMYYGRLDECRSWIHRCVQLYREAGGENLTYPVPNDAGLAALAILPTIEWLLGDTHASEEAMREGLAHVQRLNRDFDKAYLHAWIAGTRYTQRRYKESSEHAQIAVAISQKNGFREWYVTGLLIDLLTQPWLNESPEARNQALTQAAEVMLGLAKEGVGLNASWYLWALARGHQLAGNTPVAQHLISDAFLRAEASAETRMNSELLMLQAELEPNRDAALQMLAKALKIAEEQGAIANALRAATALVLRRSTVAQPALELARETDQVLQGQRECPKSPGWMKDRLNSLSESVAADSAVAERA